jgi:hypothetical protein
MDEQAYEQDRFERNYLSCKCTVCYCLNYVHIDEDTVCEKCREGEHNVTGDDESDGE